MASFIELFITLFALSNLILAVGWLTKNSKIVSANYFLIVVLSVPIVSLLQGLIFRFDVFPDQSAITIIILLLPHFYGHLFAPALWWYYRKLTRQPFSFAPHFAIWIIDIASLLVLLSRSELTTTISIVNTYLENPWICDLYNISAVSQLVVYCIVVLVDIRKKQLRLEPNGLKSRLKNAFEWVYSLALLILLIHVLSFPLIFILPQYIIDFGLIQIVYNILAMFVIFYLIKHPALFSKSIPEQRNTVENRPLEISIGAEIERHQLFLDPDLNLQKIALHFQKSTSWLNANLNEEFPDQNLSEVINSYRIAHAKTMLTQENFDHYSMEAIGFESGFNSRASFFRVFKQHVGKTPSAFKKERKVN